MSQPDDSLLGATEAQNTPPAVRLRVQVSLRWLAIIGQLAAVLIVYFGFGFNLPIIEALGAIGLAMALNLWLILRYPVSHLLTRNETAIYLACDMGQLGLLLYLTGGLMNPFALLLLAPATISASLLEARTTFILVVFSALLVSFLAFFHLPLPWAGASPDIPDLYRFGIWTALILALAFIPTYVWGVSREGRRMSAALTATRFVLAREQRLSALDGLAAAAAHQLGTPLGTIVLVSKELARRDDIPDTAREDIELMREQALRCRDILSSLGSEDDDPVISRVSLTGLLEEAVLEAGMHDKEIHISSIANGLLATGEPYVMRSPELIYGLGNLIENAAEFAASAVWVRASYSAQQVIVDIADDGPGFKPDILTHLGEPYTSSRGTARNADDAFGLGLGFFIARTLLLRSGAQISARNMSVTELMEGAMPGGACVRVVWPRTKLAVDKPAYFSPSTI